MGAHKVRPRRPWTWIRAVAPARRAHVWAVLLLGALATACAPAVEPVRTVPLDASPVLVGPGASVRVVATVGYGEFDLKPGDLEPLPFPEIFSPPREDVTSSFVLRDADAPDGWRVSLDEVERIVASLGAAGRSYALDVVIRVTAPADAEPGSYRVAALVHAPGAGGVWLEVVLVVVRRERPAT